LLCSGLSLAMVLLLNNRPDDDVPEAQAPDLKTVSVEKSDLPPKAQPAARKTVGLMSNLAQALLTMPTPKDPFPEWQDYAPEGKRFRVRMPGLPKRVEQKVPQEKGEPLLTIRHQLMIGDLMLVVCHTDVAGRVFTPAEITKIYDGGRDGIVKNIQGTLLEYKEVEIDGRNGREALVAAQLGQKPIHVRTRLLLVQSRLYQLAVFAAPDAMPAPEVDYFFRSLKIGQ
jgi:hypothetical protein